MTHAIMILRAEHRKLARLLGLMENLEQKIADGQRPDFRLLRDIGEYLSGYPDQCHHPKEDLIYRRLIKRGYAPKQESGDLTHEHEQLSLLIKKYVDLLTKAESNGGASTQVFGAGMRELIENYKRHMDMEETYFFPAALENLTDGDWAEVNYAVSEQDDPLFDDAVAKFDRLRDEVFRLASEDDQSLKSRTRVEQRLIDMEVLETVDQFNSFIAGQYPQFQMSSDKTGGFRLDGDGRTVLRIPACDEKSAAWCAYCFLTGKQS